MAIARIWLEKSTLTGKNEWQVLQADTVHELCAWKVLLSNACCHLIRTKDQS